jgi:tetratricopeptide (TPR) repeat protein
MSLRKFAIVTAATAALFSSQLLACPKCEAISDSAPAVLFEDVTALSHPITTTSAEAQKYFNQGLTLTYAFNHDEAIRSFKEAAKLDPNCAMAWWGVALALGPNYNFDVTPEGEVAAYEAIQKAMKLREKVSPAERDYIDALAVRYTDAKEPDLKKLANAYATAMKSLHMKYPDDMDAATLFADSMMVLRPWRLWTSDGKPEEGTLELVAVLEDVLSKNPNHIGANHLYIHAVEAVYPERALAAADRLPGLSPGSGHIVHMPSHIYHRRGDYNSSAMTNEAAIIADDAYFASRPRTGAYAMM